MKRLKMLLSLPLCACALALATPVAAQEDPRPLEERIRAKFEHMVRQELVLTDEQAERVMPLIRKMEDERRDVAHERREIVMSLRRGMKEGASDGELQGLLDRLVALEEDRSDMERETMRDLDAELNVRQRVQLRFCVHEFREQLRARLEQRDRERAKRHGPKGERPPRPR